MIGLTSIWSPMSLSTRLVALRKQHGLSQQAMADAIGIHANSLKKYETEHAQPSLEVLKKIAMALHVTTDYLLFETNEREPRDELTLQFEAVGNLSEDEQAIIKEVLDSLIIKYQTRRWDSTRPGDNAPDAVARLKRRGAHIKKQEEELKE
jgi:transcriptional regulator with XRE-family HTH domain